MSWKDMNKGAMHLHGHVHLPGHNKHAGDGRIMDVGVDANSMLPVAFRAIAMMLKNREPISSLPFPDHHSKNIR
jgi:calcineurin-like phosphoesterase family protein